MSKPTSDLMWGTRIPQLPPGVFASDFYVDGKYQPGLIEQYGDQGGTAAVETNACRSNGYDEDVWGVFVDVPAGPTREVLSRRGPFDMGAFLRVSQSDPAYLRALEAAQAAWLDFAAFIHEKGVEVRDPGLFVFLDQ